MWKCLKQWYQRRARQRRAYWVMNEEKADLFRKWEERRRLQTLDPVVAFEEAVELYERHRYYFSRADKVRMWDLGIPTDNNRLPYAPDAFGEPDEIR